MKLGSTVKLLALAAGLLMVETGCGGFQSTQTVSPLMFLLPGIAQAPPTPAHPSVPGQTETNLVVAQAN